MKRTIIQHAVVIFALSFISTACGTKGNEFAQNYPTEINSGGVVIQIGRILVAETKTIKEDFLSEPYFQDKPVVVEIIFVIKNNSGGTASVYPDQALVAINGEQVDLYATPAIIGEYIGGEILPGITKIGGFWFGVRRSTVDEIKDMAIIVSEPRDVYANSLGPEYHFQIDLSDHRFDPIPDEFKF